MAGISSGETFECLGLSDTDASCFEVIGQGVSGSSSLGPKLCESQELMFRITPSDMDTHASLINCVCV